LSSSFQWFFCKFWNWSICQMYSERTSFEFYFKQKTKWKYLDRDFAASASKIRWICWGPWQHLSSEILASQLNTSLLDLLFEVVALFDPKCFFDSASCPSNSTNGTV
jgi:hypothetical protein